MSRELQEILDSGELTGYTLDPQTSPTHVEGNVWYDSDEKALSYQTDVSGVELTVGQEFYVRVYNNTGATITNGSVVRLNGVYGALNLPQIVLAIADTLANAITIGVATHDIADASVGFITTSGLVRDIDLTSYTEGEPVFLSDTVAGELTETPPDITTLVGRVIDNSATGILLVKAHSDIAIPHGIGMLSGKAAALTLTTSYQTIASWTNAESYIIQADDTTGFINLLYAGIYRFNLTFDVTYTSVPGSNEIHFQLYNETDAVAIVTATHDIVTSQIHVHDTFSVPIAVTALDKDYSLRVNASTTITNFAFNTLTFDITAIKMDML